jgi:hypothetical protein
MQTTAERYAPDGASATMRGYCSVGVCLREFQVDDVMRTGPMQEDVQVQALQWTAFHSYKQQTQLGSWAQSPPPHRINQRRHISTKKTQESNNARQTNSDKTDKK